MRQLKLFKSSDLYKTDHPNVQRPYPVGLPLDNDHSFWTSLDDEVVDDLSDNLPSDIPGPKSPVKPIEKEKQRITKFKTEYPKHKMLLRTRTHNI